VPAPIALAKPTSKDTTRQTALKTNNEATCEPLTTPNQLDVMAKKQTIVVRQACNGVKQRNKAIAVTAANNGTGALSNELQLTSARPAATNKNNTNNNNTVNTSSTSPTINKRKRKVALPVPIATVATAVSASPAKRKCQGCIHGDLLEMTVMECRHVKFYLKPQEFLEKASCAGSCKQTINNIYQAAPKAILYFCDEMIKGFRAPHDDPGKSDLECGLILCVPCHAEREVKYNLERGNHNATQRRSSRRATK
jgi:hypothetical protein